jgi:hypothetical protein
MTEGRQDDSDIVREEEAAAASAAGHIGGTAGDEDDFDPAMRAVYEAGGGVAEGFEQAEAELVDRVEDPAQPGAHPHGHERYEDKDALNESVEAAEADHEHSSERTDDDR